MNKNQRLAAVLAIICASIILLGMAAEWNDHQTTRISRSVDQD